METKKTKTKTNERTNDHKKPGTSRSRQVGALSAIASNTQFDNLIRQPSGEPYLLNCSTSRLVRCQVLCCVPKPRTNPTNKPDQQTQSTHLGIRFLGRFLAENWKIRLRPVSASCDEREWRWQWLWWRRVGSSG